MTIAGEDTAGRFCAIDMHIPPGGGPAPHRHDFEEPFILLEGEGGGSILDRERCGLNFQHLERMTEGLKARSIRHVAMDMDGRPSLSAEHGHGRRCDSLTRKADQVS